MSSISPTQRSLALIREDGGAPWIVERWTGPVKVDLYNLFDLLVVYPRKPHNGILAVQTTTASNASSRVEKIRDSPYTVMWLRSGGRIQVHGWAKRGARGERKAWSCRVLEVVIKDSGELSFVEI